MADQTILVTGATDGLGRALAHELARAGATVVVHGRDDARGRETVDAIRAATGGRVEWLRADLASLAGVRQLAAQVVDRYERLDVLVSNAGVGSTLPGDGARMTSADGHELRFAVNYLAPFLLARLLAPLLARSAPARVVNVASAGQAPIDFDDVMLERAYDGGRAYAQSKLALIMATFDLADDLGEHGVTANALHPGTYMPTKMVVHAGLTPVDTLASGVAATARLAVADDVAGVTGRYFDRQREARAQPQAYDAEARRRLRALSEALTGLAPDTAEAPRRDGRGASA